MCSSIEFKIFTFSIIWSAKCLHKLESLVKVFVVYRKIHNFFQWAKQNIFIENVIRILGLERILKVNDRSETEWSWNSSLNIIRLVDVWWLEWKLCGNIIVAQIGSVSFSLSVTVSPDVSCPNFHRIEVQLQLCIKLVHPHYDKVRCDRMMFLARPLISSIVVD